MAKLNWNKNKAASVKSNYSAIQKGCYKMVVKKSEITISACKSKEVLKLTMMIEEGNYKGKFVFPRFNISNPSDRAVAISHMLLGKLSESIGIDELEDTDQLIGKQFLADVIIVPPKGTYGESNDIVNYYPSNPLPKKESTPVVAKNEPADDNDEAKEVITDNYDDFSDLGKLVEIKSDTREVIVETNNNEPKPTQKVIGIEEFNDFNFEFDEGSNHVEKEPVATDNGLLEFFDGDIPF